MGDQFRKIDQYSPKSSPRGARSPVVPRQDSTGTLRATISLGKNPSIVHSGPFYLMKEPPMESEITGATNLMQHHALEHSYSKFCVKKMKDQLSSFLPMLPGVIDTPGHQDNSSLRSLIEKPPIIGKEIHPLTTTQLSGFRLHPGPLPEQFRFLTQAPQKKIRHKKKKHKAGDTPSHEGAEGESHEKKHRKQKRHDEDADDKERRERKKRKKEKKKKKQKHSPEHPGLSLSQQSNGSTKL